VTVLPVVQCGDAAGRCPCQLPAPSRPLAPPHPGISPITRDFVNPERAWPHLQRLAAATAAAGKALLPRLPVYPAYLQHQQLQPAGAPPAAQSRAWLDGGGGRDSPLAAALRLADAEGLARGSSWAAGAAEAADRGAGEEGWGQHTAPPAAPPATPSADGGQPPLKSSVPGVRRRGGGAAWRVSLRDDGLLQGCAAPADVSAGVRELLEGVLEGGRELVEAEVELLLRGERAPGCRGWGLCRCWPASRTAALVLAPALHITAAPAAAPRSPRRRLRGGVRRGRRAAAQGVRRHRHLCGG
jgi:hypothetical protein